MIFMEWLDGNYLANEAMILEHEPSNNIMQHWLSRIIMHNPYPMLINQLLIGLPDMIF